MSTANSKSAEAVSAEHQEIINSILAERGVMMPPTDKKEVKPELNALQMLKAIAKRDELKALCESPAFQSRLAEYRKAIQAEHEPVMFLRGMTCCEYWERLNRACPRSRQGREVFRMMERAS